MKKARVKAIFCHCPPDNSIPQENVDLVILAGDIVDQDESSVRLL